MLVTPSLFIYFKTAKMVNCPTSPVTLTGSSGTFTSPNFKTYNRYGNNYKCRWLITVAEDKVS